MAAFSFPSAESCFNIHRNWEDDAPALPLDLQNIPMIPAFALVFSEDTVTLLHRDGDWMPLGKVSLDSPDLPDQLGDLRALAEARAGGDFTTKLVIPASQIRFTVARLAEGADEGEQVRAALEGRTPYDVAELVCDWQMIGQDAHIAVVARETLHEAEGFATDHGFNPVAFGAIAPDGRHPEEPWFGPTMVAPRFLGEEVAERDPLPLKPLPAVVAPPLPSDTDKVFATAEPEAEPEAPPAPLWDEPEPVAVPDAYADHHAAENDEPPLPDAPEVWAGHDDIADRHADARFDDFRTSVTDDAGYIPAGDDHHAANEDPPLPEDESAVPEDVHTPMVADFPLPEDAPAPLEDDLPVTHAVRTEGEATAVPQDAVPTEEGRDQAAEALTPTAEAPARAERVTIAAPAILAPARPLPVFDHPSFAQKPALRAERDLAAPRRVDSKSAKVVPPVSASPKEAPFVDFGRRIGTTSADMIPPPLRVTQTRAASLAAQAPAKQRPRYLGFILTAVLLVVLAVIAAASAFFIDDEAQITSQVDQPAPVVELAGAGVQPAFAGPAALPQYSTAPAFVSRFQLIPTASADERPALPGGALAQTAAKVAEASPAPDPRFANVSPRARPASMTPPEAAPDTTDAASVIQEVEGLRPRLRPEDLQPTPEELVEAEDTEGQMQASPRPITRPETVASAAIVAPPVDETGTALAVAVSQRPEMRPSGISRASVNAALAAALEPPPAAAVPAAPAAAPPAQVASVAAPRAAAPRQVEAEDEPAAPRSAVPNIPTKASVAQQATETGALPLGRTNVISITGANSNRTALVRAGNGRISRLRVGDRIDGGVVAAITQNAIHYRKGNTLYALEMPS